MSTWDAFAIDIETADGSPDDAERWVRDCYQPDSFKEWQPETIAKRIREAYETKIHHLGLLDASPIISVGLKSTTHWMCLHTLFEHAPGNLGGATVVGFRDLPALLVELRQVLDTCCTHNTIISGHNILAFDLRKLRLRYGFHNIRQPRILADLRQPTFDTMLVYGRHFSVNRRKFEFASLDEVLQAFGLPSHKGAVSGAMVPELYRQAQYATLVQYQLLDVANEWTLFLRMSGSAPDMR